MATVECAPTASGRAEAPAWDRELLRVAAPLLETLPHGASMCLLRALNGLSASEREVLCAKVATLKVEKQFRVIHAMSVSTLDGKRRFLETLARKVDAKQQQERRVRGASEPDPDPGRLDAGKYRHAVDRVRRLNPTAKHHSFNAALGAALRNAPPTDASDDSWVGLHSSALAPIPEHAPLLAAPRASSMSSLETMPTTNMSKLSRLLAGTHISDSERNLRELERHRQLRDGKIDSTDNNTDVEMSENTPEGSKRERSDSDKILAHQEQKPLQRPRMVSASSLSSRHHKPLIPWTATEDRLLTSLVCQGRYNWKEIAERIPTHTPKECRSRWKNDLDPSINRAPFTPAEDALLMQAYEKLGNKWSQIALVMKGRSEDAIKVRWRIMNQQRASWS